MKKLTDNSAISDLGARSHEVREEIMELRKNLSLSSIRLAYLLKQVKEKKLFSDWGHPSFESAIADPDISISRSTAYGLIQVWETWVEKYGKTPDEVAEIPYDKLLLIAPIVDEDNMEEMFENAKALSRQDLQHMKLEKKANQDLPDFKPMPKLYRCRHCGLWVFEADDNELCRGH